MRLLVCTRTNKFVGNILPPESSQFLWCWEDEVNSLLATSRVAWCFVPWCLKQKLLGFLVFVSSTAWTTDRELRASKSVEWDILLFWTWCLRRHVQVVVLVRGRPRPATSKQYTTVGFRQFHGLNDRQWTPGQQVRWVRHLLFLTWGLHSLYVQLVVLLHWTWRQLQFCQQVLLVVVCSAAWTTDS